MAEEDVEKRLGVFEHGGVKFFKLNPWNPLLVSVVGDSDVIYQDKASKHKSLSKANALRTIQTLRNEASEQHSKSQLSESQNAARDNTSYLKRIKSRPRTQMQGERDEPGVLSVELPPVGEKPTLEVSVFQEHASFGSRHFTVICGDTGAYR